MSGRPVPEEATEEYAVLLLLRMIAREGWDIHALAQRLEPITAEEFRRRYATSAPTRT